MISDRTPEAVEPTASIRESKPLRVLIMGGTGFLGPNIVRAAVAQGHKVTIFNRGTRNIDLPPSVERLVGDRAVDLELIKNREWDAVIDVAVYVPERVRSLAAALKGRVNHYTMISSISVYDDPRGADEDAAVLPYTGAEDPYDLTTYGEFYGALKAVCEREAQQQFPGKTLVVRPGYIVGDREPGEAMTYLVTRMRKGGEVLLCGSPSTPVQFIDVRDLGEWIVRLVEGNVTGVLNAAGPSTPMTLAQLTETAMRNAQASAKLTWVPSEWLSARADRDLFKPLLFWTSEKGGYGHQFRINLERALSKGLRTRPPSATCADISQAYDSRTPNEQFAFNLRKKKDGVMSVSPVTWSTYLALEKEALTEWHRSAARLGA